MTGNIFPVRTNPGYGQGNSRCKHCNEYETLGHMLGKCRNNSYHTILSLLAVKLKEKGWSVKKRLVAMSTVLVGEWTFLLLTDH